MEQTKIFQESSNLIRQINEAFKNVHLPSLEKIGTGPSAEFELDEFIDEYWNYHDDWRSVSQKALGNGSGMSFFTKEAYPFFIAAYMTQAVRKIQESDQTLMMYVLYDLCWPTKNEEFFDYCREKQSLLTREQRKKVKLFLEFVKKYSTSDEFIALIGKTLNSGIYDQ